MYLHSPIRLNAVVFNLPHWRFSVTLTEVTEDALDAVRRPSVRCKVNMLTRCAAPRIAEAWTSWRCAPSRSSLKPENLDAGRRSQVAETWTSWRCAPSQVRWGLNILTLCAVPQFAEVWTSWRCASSPVCWNLNTLTLCAVSQFDMFRILNISFRQSSYIEIPFNFRHNHRLEQPALQFRTLY